MAEPLRVSVVSTTLLVARGVRQMLEGEPDEVHCATLIGASLATAPFDPPDVLLLAPQTWEELADWVPSLRSRFAPYPWLVLAELPLAGAFFSAEEVQFCTLVRPDVSSDGLRTAARELARGHVLMPPAALPGQFVRGAAPLSQRRRVPLPTPMELQCGCAASLGMTDPQIARALHLGVATVKSHLRHFRDKLRVTNRRELGAYIRQALASSSPPP